MEAVTIARGEKAEKAIERARLTPAEEHRLLAARATSASTAITNDRKTALLAEERQSSFPECYFG